jgi:hypothetical protein
MGLAAQYRTAQAIHRASQGADAEELVVAAAVVVVVALVVVIKKNASIKHERFTL